MDEPSNKIEWFQEWREPRNFLRKAIEWIELTPADVQFTNPKINKYSREAFGAGLFATILNDHEPCKVRLVPESERFPDFQLRTRDQTVDFELTEALKPGRKRGDEYRLLQQVRARNAGHEDKEIVGRTEAQRRAREAIPKAIRDKVQKYRVGTKVNLLVYVNIISHNEVLMSDIAGEMLLSEAELVRLTKPWCDEFQSIWLLRGSRAIRTWPTSLIRTALSDPLGWSDAAH